MSSLPLPANDTESYGQWDPFGEDIFGLGETQTEEDMLGFCQLTDWDEGKTYSDDPPKYITYSIEWKVRINHREQSKDTEQNLVLELASYWRLFLKPKLEEVLRCKMLTKKKAVQSEDTKIVTSVTQRSERDFTKSFTGTDIDWSVIEKQLISWGDLCRAGKKLRINISFNYIYVESSQPSSGVDKRNASSTTRRMLTESISQLDAEQETSGQPSIWKDVYSLMRCPGPPCHLGPHCWQDPVGKKHYKLKTHHLKSLIKHVEQGQRLENHDDVPEHIRQQLYAEEQQWLERRHKTSTHAPGLPPIQITNVLPGSSGQATCSDSLSQPSETHSQSSRSKRLIIPGLRDKNFREYFAWQESKVEIQSLKDEYRKTCSLMLEDGMSLEVIHRNPDTAYLLQKGVKRGIAEHVMGDIEEWVETHKRARTEG